MKQHNRVYAKIDLDAISYNMEQMKKRIGEGARLIAVIKTDGYGHGAVPIAKMFESCSYVWGYAVACLEEGIALRENGIRKPVLVLGCVFPDQYPEMIENEIRPTVYTEEMAEEMSREAVRQQKQVCFHIKIDTGMGRIGFPVCEESADAIARIGTLPNVEMEGMFTHFAKADEKDKTYTFAQHKKFMWMKEQVEQSMLLVKIFDVQHRLIKNLSKGYRQRVGFAQAIIGFPEIIILDEPTVGLDPKQIIEIRSLIRELAKKHTVILSSHILAEVQEVCDYILIISQGRLVASDTPENLENLMSDQQTVEILARGSRDTVKKIVNSVPGIRQAAYEDGGEKQTVKVVLTPKSGADIRESLFTAFSKADCPLLMLYQSRTTLEDVFLELTQGSSAVANRKRQKKKTEREEERKEKELELMEESEREGGDRDGSSL